MSLKIIIYNYKTNVYQQQCVIYTECIVMLILLLIPTFEARLQHQTSGFGTENVNK